MSMTRTYSELRKIDTYGGRFQYLQLKGEVGQSTFGFERYVNQKFYTSRDWKQVRQHVIARDLGMDLGIEGYEIYDRIIIHHMNPMQPVDIKDGDSDILNSEFLICTTMRSHNAIHFGDEKLLARPLQERRPNDTLLW